MMKMNQGKGCSCDSRNWHVMGIILMGTYGGVEVIVSSNVLPNTYLQLMDQQYPQEMR